MAILDEVHSGIRRGRGGGGKIGELGIEEHGVTVRTSAGGWSGASVRDHS
jgi:hypothetical protein